MCPPRWPLQKNPVATRHGWCYAPSLWNDPGMAAGVTLTRTLILVRHAKSAWPPDTPDTRRPLAERGRRDAPAVGRWLRAHIATIDRVVCSPAVRAVQTWNLAAAQLPGTPPACLDERLYGASAAVLLAVT